MAEEYLKIHVENGDTIVLEAHRSGDDMSCLDIHSCYGRKEDGSSSDECNSVYLSFMSASCLQHNQSAGLYSQLKVQLQLKTASD